MMWLRKNGEPSNEAINACAKIFIVYSVFFGIHVDEGVTGHVFEEGADVYLAEDESQRVGVWISEHDKFVARDCLEEMEFVRGGAIADELFISGVISDAYYSDYSPPLTVLISF